MHLNREKHPYVYRGTIRPLYRGSDRTPIQGDLRYGAYTEERYGPYTEEPNHVSIQINDKTLIQTLRISSEKLYYLTLLISSRNVFDLI